MKRLRSAFTDDMDHCYFTGTAPVERHHIWGGANRKNSEKYGFVIPLRPDLHPNGAQAGKTLRRLICSSRRCRRDILRSITELERTSGESSVSRYCEVRG